MSTETGPWRLVAELRAWAERVPWCEWLELSGSLGRGAGDEMSDVDAGLGVGDTVPFEEARDLTAAAVRGLAPVADSIIQPYGEGIDHVIVQYADGRQLSLVVYLAARRRGLPPGARPLLGRTGLLNESWTPDVFAASAGLGSTLPGTAEREPTLAAARALAPVLEPLTAPQAVDGLRAITQGRLDYVGDDRSRGSLA